MNDSDESFDLLLKSSSWYLEQAKNLLKEYRECRTEHARQRLLPQIGYMHSKMVFEKGEIVKFMDNGDEWKHDE
jgi:hypothetical protein